MRHLSTGTAELDKLLGGGILEGSLVLIAGGPGVGKTILSAKYIYEGARRYGENGVYVCFAETKDVLIRNMKGIGCDFEAPEVADRITILDLSTKLEIGVQETVNQILETVMATKAKRLVVDSFTAISMAMTKDIEIRCLTHLVYKLLRRTGCTTIMVVDVPWGASAIGSGSEEFIADVVILMENYYDRAGKLRGRLRVLKMRGVDHCRDTVEYVITKGGIRFRRGKK